MSKHTPGPWKYSDMKDLDHFAISQEDGAPYTHHSSDVGSAFYMASCQPKSVAEANARLMAAAPDLLEALKDYVAAIPELWASDTHWRDVKPDDDEMDMDWLDVGAKARAAIAKAEGEV